MTVLTPFWLCRMDWVQYSGAAGLSNCVSCRKQDAFGWQQLTAYINSQLFRACIMASRGLACRHSGSSGQKPHLHNSHPYSTYSLCKARIVQRILAHVLYDTFRIGRPYWHVLCECCQWCSPGARLGTDCQGSHLPKQLQVPSEGKCNDVQMKGS